jgi:hypothetical protein
MAPWLVVESLVPELLVLESAAPAWVLAVPVKVAPAAPRRRRRRATGRLR